MDEPIADWYVLVCKDDKKFYLLVILGSNHITVIRSHNLTYFAEHVIPDMNVM